jgi:hypothetical protein
VVAVPIMAVMMWIGSNKLILGRYTLTRRHKILGWVATLVMLSPVIAMVVAWL